MYLAIPFREIPGKEKTTTNIEANARKARRTPARIHLGGENVRVGGGGGRRVPKRTSPQSTSLRHDWRGCCAGWLHRRYTGVSSSVEGQDAKEALCRGGGADRGVEDAREAQSDRRDGGGL